MFIKETTITNTYFKKSKFSKLVEYTRTKTIIHWQCDYCGNEFTKCKNGKYNPKSKSFCKACISKFGVAKLGNLAGYDARVNKTLSERIGKTIIGKEGYPEVYIGKNYPYRKGGYRSIREHVFVMECELKRSLEKNEVVHHIDGDKTNNNLDNLYLTTVAEHNKLHAESESIVFELVKMGLVKFDRNIGRYKLLKEKLV